MIREFGYAIRVEIEEKARTKGGSNQSNVNGLLEMFEDRVRALKLRRNGTSLTVKSIKPTEPEEDLSDSGRKIFVEEEPASYLARVRKRIRGVRR